MNNLEALYKSDTDSEMNCCGLLLSNEQKEQISKITGNILEVKESVRMNAIPNIIATLQNGHCLNRVIVDGNEVVGYIACQDRPEGEVYIKYLGTTRKTGRNLFIEIPAFIKFAQSKGYKKLSFHGWNSRLNRILVRFGFDQVDDCATQHFKEVGFFVKVLCNS